jgi:hypothetical protein
MEYEKIRPAVLSDRGGFVTCALRLDGLSELLGDAGDLAVLLGSSRTRSGALVVALGLVCGENRGRRGERARAAGLVTCLHGR